MFKDVLWFTSEVKSVKWEIQTIYDTYALLYHYIKIIYALKFIKVINYIKVKVSIKSYPQKALNAFFSN